MLRKPQNVKCCSLTPSSAFCRQPDFPFLHERPGVEDLTLVVCFFYLSGNRKWLAQLPKPKSIVFFMKQLWTLLHGLEKREDQWWTESGTGDRIHPLFWFLVCSSFSLHVFYELTPMLQDWPWESLQEEGRVYYIYILYVHKLKALILSIVFNYLRFLMMKIDCTKFFFFIILLVHVVARTDLWMVHTLLQSQLLLFILVYKKKGFFFLQSLLPIMNAQIKHL